MTLLVLFAIVVSLFNGQPSPFVQGLVDGKKTELRGGLFVKDNYEGYQNSMVDKYLMKKKGSKGRFSKSKGHKGKKHDKKKAKHHNGKQHGKKNHKKSTKHYSYTPAPTPLETIIVPDKCRCKKDFSAEMCDWCINGSDKCIDESCIDKCCVIYSASPAPTPLETFIYDHHLRNDNTNQMGTNDDLFPK